MRYGVRYTVKLFSVFYVSFFAVQNGDKETRGCAAGQRVAGIGRTFFLKFGPSRLTSKYQPVVYVKFLARSRALRMYERKDDVAEQWRT